MSGNEKNNLSGIMDIAADIASEMTDEELDDLYARAAGSDDSYCIVYTDAGRYKVKTEYVRLEIERIRKNRILKNSIGKIVRVEGVAGNVKLYDNTALFCLSPCSINGTEIGHTWVRYTPDFKRIKHGSFVAFYAGLKRYGTEKLKSGVDWEDLSYVRISEGDNLPLHFIKTDNAVLQYIPEQKASLHRIRLESNDCGEYIYDPLKRELTCDGRVIPLSPDAQGCIDDLAFYEWLARLEEYEFWYFVNRTNR